ALPSSVLDTCRGRWSKAFGILPAVRSVDHPELIVPRQTSFSLPPQCARASSHMSRGSGSALRADGASVTLSDTLSLAGAHPHVCLRAAIGDCGAFSRTVAQRGRAAPLLWRKSDGTFLSARHDP